MTDEPKTTQVHPQGHIQTGVQLDKMQESPHIWANTDYSELEDVDIDETKIFWMGTNANLSDTPQEQLENRMAIQEQIKNGILDEFGLPIGFSYDELGIPKDKQEEIRQVRLKRSQQQPQQSIPQHVNMPNRAYNVAQEKKVYKSKLERKIDRARLKEELKKQEKLARANKVIQQHQQK